MQIFIVIISSLTPNSHFLSFKGNFTSMTLEVILFPQFEALCDASILEGSISHRSTKLPLTHLFPLPSPLFQSW